MVKFTKKETEIKLNGLVAVLYGEPGSGKTSLAFSAGKCVMFNADQCTAPARAINRKDFLHIIENENHRYALPQGHEAITITDFFDLVTNNNLVKVIEESDESLRGLDSIIIDHVDSLLYMMMQDIKRTDKAMSMKNGNLSQAGYGVLKNRFKIFSQELRRLGKNIIFISHESNPQSKDNVIDRVKPQITGGSYNILIESCDILAHVKSIDNIRTIQLNACDRYLTKNPANFADMKVPDFSFSDNDFMLEKMIKPTLDAMSQSVVRADMNRKLIEQYNAKIDGCTDATIVNEILDDILQFKQSNAGLFRLLGKRLSDKIAELNLVKNESTGKFEPIAG